MRSSRLHGPGAGPIARAAGRAYAAPVSFRRILSFFVLLGLIMAPAGMLGAPAMAMTDGAMPAMSHHDGAQMAAHPCAEKQEPADRQAPDNCCVMTCVAIPSIGGELAVHALPPRMRQPPSLVSVPHGLDPEADPPPPRFS